jgi:hypothetical protein
MMLSWSHFGVAGPGGDGWVDSLEWVNALIG